MNRRDPYQGFRFQIEVEGITVGGFSRVKGIARETRYETYREGGVNDFEHKLATLTTFGNLVLERGLLADSLWTWHDDVVGGTVQRHKITIALRDETGSDVWRWYVDGAFPVKWSISDFDAAGSQVTVESVEFAHHGMRKA
ncbi:phage tail-like protein [Paraburkholderia sp. RAU2J]|uniref:phage tail protein n=1 Tax=Paraburkholderia sp. RAU2J TaxID=1938810 RepID=UPI000EAEA369|nr:phage tail protein [Paraburkholderia sp. RAU2J]RKT13298.1 phage tail-like protein [Paraburkholderia sp. RAU2J]